MVYEQVLTILFAMAVGAAIIVYAARPRQRSVPASISHVATLESYGQAEAAQAAPMPQVTAVEAPAVATTVSETQSVAWVAPAAAEVAAAGSSETTPLPEAPGIDVSAVAPTPAVESSATVSQSSTRSHRAPKRKSTTTSRSRAKPSQRTRKS